MKRTLLKTLAAVVLLAAPAVAQDGNFTWLSGSSNRLNFQGQWNADYPGGDVLTPPALGTSFAVFCVDPYNFISTGVTYDAWVTGIASANTGVIASQTRLGQNFGGASAYGRYWRAAYLVSNFQLIGSPTLTQESDYQQAIWEVTWGYLTNSTAASNALAATANGITPTATGFSTWGVITDFANVRGPGARQEFIYNQPGGGLEIVPEPATMSLLAMGLAGMAGAGMRRRKQSKS